MNNTITLPQVITQLAKLTNTDSNTARLFLRAFFATIEKNLAAGETVVIKNIGTFKRSDDPAFGNGESVMFVPDKAITDEINAPFAMFSAVEVASGLDDSDLAEAEPKAEPEPVAEVAVTADEEVLEPELPAAAVDPAPTAAVEAEPVAPEPEPPTGEPTITAQPETPAEKVAPAAVEPEPTPAPGVRPTSTVIDDEPEEIATEAPRKKSRVWLWAAIIVLIAIVGGYFAAVYAVPDFEWDDEAETPQDEIELPVEPLPEIDVDQAGISAYNHADNAVADEAPAGNATEPTAPAAEEVKETPAAPVQTEPKYDTVTSKRFLSTMAREYYGQNIFWVYIYEANKDHLGDPNKVGAGTRVVIPDKSSLPQASSQKEAIRMAEKKAAEIEARFGR